MNASDQNSEKNEKNKNAELNKLNKSRKFCKFYYKGESKRKHAKNDKIKKLKIRLKRGFKRREYNSDTKRDITAYGALSESYDALMTDADYDKRAAFLIRQFRRRGFKTILDLGCGTGTIAWLLSRKGYRVIAVDASSEMLTEAMGKAAAYPGFSPPLFVRQSMSRLDLGRQEVDAAISTLDALNYLISESDLRETFRRVYQFLRPGGLFLFDVNTPHKLRRMDKKIYMDESNHIFCVWRTFFTEKTGICVYQVDLFSQRPDGAWDRRFEEHQERAWSEEQLREFLSDAGFTRIQITGDLSGKPPARDADRWLVRAEKK